VPCRKLTVMSSLNDTTTTQELTEVFIDPVAYLAAHGIEATLVDETAIPAAA
jgi:hypothetical protein